MGKWLLVAAGVVTLGAAVAVAVGQRRETGEVERQTAALRAAGSPSPGGGVALDALSDLPPPVERYLRHVLTDGQGRVHTAVLDQSGTLRTGTESEAWLAFTARHVAAPRAPGFLWDARVAMPFGTHIRVLDSYREGVGSGRVSLLSAFVVDSEAGAPELNSGALHRYLAEAVWYPTALLPGSGVEWSPVDDRSAVATLTDRGTTVSLEFRFNDQGEVAGIFSPGRFRRAEEGYERVPWEGRFARYETRDGMRVPRYGEVGWHDEAGDLQLVWRGEITHATYEFEPSD